MKSTRVCQLLLLSAAMLPPAGAFAQEAGKSGVTMGVPGSIGFIYHVTDSVAVRPDVSLGFGSSSSSSVPSISSSLWSTGIGVSVLFYLSNQEHVRPYVSPRFTYSRNSSSTDSPSVFGSSTTTTTLHGNSYAGIGSAGVQYTPTERFGIFGEVGFGYTRSSAKSDFTGSSIRSSINGNNWNTRAGVGVVLYF